MIQIRNVPDAIHRKLKARAASEGVSLSDFMLREAIRMAELPTRDELYERLNSREPTGISVETIVKTVREMRGD